MWSRAQLKDRAKEALKRNYWKLVLVSVIMILIGSSGSGSVSSFNTDSFTEGFENGFEAGYNGALNNDIDSDFTFGADDYYFEDEEDVEDYLFGEDDYYFFDEDSYYEEEVDIIDDFSSEGYATVASVIGIAIVIFLIIFVIALVIGFALQAFLLNPIDVGCRRFCFKNLTEKASIKELAFAFDSNYKNVVKTLFFRDLYVFLWSLLFVIPGIVKGYEYKMMPYLLAENPSLSKDQAFAISKQMMDGQKWKAFVLDLSFIGWNILSACTLGILSFFYVAPYKNMTDAALYEALCYNRQYTSYSQPNTAYYPYGQQPVEPQMIEEPVSEDVNTDEV